MDPENPLDLLAEMDRAPIRAEITPTRFGYEVKWTRGLIEKVPASFRFTAWGVKRLTRRWARQDAAEQARRRSTVEINVTETPLTAEDHEAHRLWLRDNR